jgi:5-methylcytosine-specific restriction endonuclease McrA
MKKPSISKYKTKVDGVFSEYIRTRDGCCVRCGATTNLQCSHTIPKSHGNILRYDERNGITLCYHCHLSWWHKNPVEAGEWFKSRFPDDYEYLEAKKNETLKLSIDKLKEIEAHYKDKLRGGYNNEKLDK